ncbi:MAG: lipoprotein [Pseudomonadota bacterium]
MTAVRVMLMAAALSTVLAACGRRGDPKPPPLEEPAAEKPAEEG